MADIPISKTKKRLSSSIYSAQCYRSKRDGRRQPEYTRKELYEWLMSLSEFHVLYNEWVNSGYDKWLIPSVDRLNDKIHYMFGNVQLLTWRDNFLKEQNNKKQSVVQLDKSGMFINSFESSLSASNSNEKWHDTNISRVCNGLRNTAYGFIWKWEKDL